MRPSAPLTSPSPTPMMQSNGNLAMIPYDSNDVERSQNGGYSAVDATNFKHAGASPRELILHESISHLVAEVAELRSRCEGVEAMNEQLLKRTTDLEQSYCDSMERLPLTKANLTGYASSESGSVSEDGSAAKQDPEMNHRFGMVARILEDYEGRLQAQVDSQGKLEASIAELNTYKRSSETLFKALKNELEGLDLLTPPKSDDDGFFGQQPSASDIATTFVDKHERLEGRFNMLELEVTARVKDIDDRLQTATEAIQAGVASTGYHGAGGSDLQLSQLKAKVDQLSNFRQTWDRKSRQEQAIDDASTKDALYRMYADIDSIMISDDQRRKCADFEGTFDELWPLRDRIICHVAAFDGYGAAFDEVKRAVRELA